MGNSETERTAIEYVMELERSAGRVPVDVHLKGAPYDVSSPPRKIEVKAFGRSARGAPRSRSKTGRSKLLVRIRNTSTSTLWTTWRTGTCQVK
jgi:hypothetical protein